MDTQWDREVDFVVAGTGAAGLSAAITAARAGLDVILVESESRWGGTTGISGGGLWLPDNPLMHRDGVADSVEEALVYMDQIIPDLGPHTSRARKLAFLEGVQPYVTMLSDEGIEWSRSKDYPDYYPDLPGGKIGRALEVKSFDMHKLKGFQYRSRMKQGIPAPLRNDDVWLLGRAWSSPGGFIRGAQFVFRTLFGLATGRQERGMGPALAGALMWVAQKHGVPVWLESPLTEVVLEGDAVAGAVIEHEGRAVRVRARRGVMLAAGGFALNTEWRQKHHGIPGWSAAPEGQQGTGITAGHEAGGALALMDDAWWGAGVVVGEGVNSFVLGERSFPHSIVVDQSGQRYLNESESYVDFGHHMLERDKVSAAVPSWLVHDVRSTRRYLNTFAIMGKKWMAESGEMVHAASLEQLAEKMGVDKETFRATLVRFNRFAKAGVDEDFGRGRTEYDRYYGDPGVKPNPNLGAISRGPFTAYKIYPGDLGTKGGLVTDEHARVLREDGAVIAGLYAAGNNTASVMGRTYPGPGSSISPAGIFGYLGALHAAARIPAADPVRRD